MKPGRKQRWRHVWAEANGLPIGESERIEITKKGNLRSILIEGVHHILLYGIEEMIFSISGGQLEIRGQELSCTSYVSGAVCITGEISTLVFSPEGTYEARSC